MNQGVDSVDKPQPLMSRDWREQTNELIGITLADRGVSLILSNRADKRAIVDALEKSEIFQIRGSAQYLSKALGIPRANLYGLLRVVRNDQ